MYHRLCIPQVCLDIVVSDANGTYGTCFALRDTALLVYSSLPFASLRFASLLVEVRHPIFMRASPNPWSKCTSEEDAGHLCVHYTLLHYMLKCDRGMRQVVLRACLDDDLAAVLAVPDLWKAAVRHSVTIVERNMNCRQSKGLPAYDTRGRMHMCSIMGYCRKDAPLAAFELGTRGRRVASVSWLLPLRLLSARLGVRLTLAKDDAIDPALLRLASASEC